MSSWLARRQERGRLQDLLRLEQEVNRLKLEKMGCPHCGGAGGETPQNNYYSAGPAAPRRPLPDPQEGPQEDRRQEAQDRREELYELI